MSASENPSAKWGPTTKLVVGLSFVAIAAALLSRFQNLIGPLLLVFILSYLLYPLIAGLSRVTKLSWTAAANLVFLTVVILLLGMFVVLGLAIFQQAENLIGVVNDFIIDLPDLIDRITNNLPAQITLFGQFNVDVTRVTQIFSQIDLQSLAEQVLAILQPLLGRAGGLIGAFASTTVSGLGWGAFVLVISYFIMSDLGHTPTVSLVGIDIPKGYEVDVYRLMRDLGHIWNAFVRGQFVLFGLTIILSAILMTLLGVRNALALALLAGFARFVPYVGPFVTWSVTAVVAIFQPTNWLGLDPVSYTILVVLAAVVLDQIFDNYISPRLYGEALGVHPAAVLVAAIIAANLIGLVGLLLAAPVLATLLMFGRYAIRKMLDLDPWPEGDVEPEGWIANLSWDTIIEQARVVRSKLWRLRRVSPGKGQDQGE